MLHTSVPHIATLTSQSWFHAFGNSLGQEQVWVTNGEGDTVYSYRDSGFRFSYALPDWSPSFLADHLVFFQLFYKCVSIFLPQFPEILGIDRVRFAAPEELFVFGVI